MASRTRDSTAPGKEKRGTSPSSARRRSLNPSNPGSPARASTGSSEKPVPNYLKPTICSSILEMSKQQSKKPASSPDSATRPAFARRRSFDKPPSPSRSSCSSGRNFTTSSSQKVVSDKNAKRPKEAGKQHSLYARPVNSVKNKPCLAKKQDGKSGSSSRTKGKGNATIVPEKVDVSNPDGGDNVESETQSQDQESPVAEGDDQIAAEIERGNEEEEGVKELVEEDQESGDIEKTEDGGDEMDDKVMNVDSSPISEQQDPDAVSVEPSTVSENQEHETVKVESSTIPENQEPDIANVGSSTVSQNEEPKMVTDETSTVSEVQGEDKPDAEEIVSSKETEPQENAADEAEKIVTEENVAESPNKEKEIPQKEDGDGKKEEAAGGSEANESKETEVKEVVVEEKIEGENAEAEAKAKAQPAAKELRKQDSALSNDVIEETATKLREQRKNKVKALAGAFETVISLQDPK